MDQFLWIHESRQEYSLCQILGSHAATSGILLVMEGKLITKLAYIEIVINNGDFQYLARFSVLHTVDIIILLDYGHELFLFLTGI